MHRAQEQVRDFMRAMGQPTPKQITRLPADRAAFRLELICEEYQELHDAIGPDTLPAQIDALCDLLYVVYGMAVEMGVDLEPFFELVHEANMKKGPGPVREDGKKLKPEGWEPPDIEGALKRYELFDAVVEAVGQEVEGGGDAEEP